MCVFIMLFLFLVTANQTKWDQHDNTTHLDNRIDDITKWKETLERCLAETDAEIAVSSRFVNYEFQKLKIPKSALRPFD